MRASAVRTALIDRIEAITPDDQATHRDRFVALDLRHNTDRGVTVADRCFTVELAQLTPSILITPNTQNATYEIDVYYMAQNGVEDRIALDAERIINALYSIHEQAADLYRSYNYWADEQGIGKKLGMKSFRDRLTRLNFGSRRTKDARYVTGIRIRRSVSAI